MRALKEMRILRMRLSYVLYIVLSIVLFTSCNGDDPYECFKAVEKEFPNYIRIVKPRGEKYSFVVIDADSSIYFVRTMNFNDVEMSDKQLIHKW